MAMVETYEEVGETDCPLCTDPVVRLDEVVVLTADVVLHADCFQRSTTEQIYAVVRRCRVRALNRQDTAA